LALIFVCQPDNDLYRVLARLNHTPPRYGTLDQALEAAPRGTAVLSLADTYPRPSPAFDQRHADWVRAKGVRLYLEYPASLPGTSLGEPRPTTWERVVVTSDFFAPQVARHTILAQHGCWYLPFAAASPSAALPRSPGSCQPGQGDDNHVERRPRPSAPAEEPSSLDDLYEGMDVHLAVARVAGYDHAVYGLPAEAHPILFALPGSLTILVATSALSRFVRGRYGPQDAWKAIWERLLRWFAPAEELPDLTWTPTVRVQAGLETLLPEDAEREALCRSVRWFREHVVYSIDWKKGAIEGFESGIDHEGRQKRRPWARGDCTAETGMVFACDWALTHNPDSALLSRQILDYVWSAPDFHQDDPDSPAYGLNNWYERGPVFYGDDNARVIMPTLVARHLLADDRWDERVLRCLLANLRTTGRLGYRRNRIDLGPLLEQDRGWAFYYDEEIVSCAPHYQAYLWAAYLLAFALTGFDGFLDRTRTAIRMTMEVYPRWRWTNGLTQELARMLLPLAFLVRVEDTPEHRCWLKRIAADLLAQMQPCGAIREQLGPLESGRYGPPASNEAYGTAEAPLIQANGDPACDLLYTTNYAFLGLHEAAAVTGDGEFAEAEGRLAEFLCRIQVRSEAHPYLDGAWMRGFDYQRWEYWGSSADAGWGAWSVESGWTNTWIATVLALRQLERSLFDLATARPLSTDLDGMVAQMLPALAGP
jgi:hypothetical protein